MYDKKLFGETVAIQRFIMLHKDDELFNDVDIHTFLDFIVKHKDDIKYLVKEKEDVSV